MGIFALVACVPAGFTDDDKALLGTLSPIPAPAPSPTNRFADDPGAAALGEVLFSDAGLSADGERSCATCHSPDRHFTDGNPVATAIGVGTRNVPTAEAAAWQTWFFWDGRADSAWAQATGPLTNPIEMGNTAEGVHARVVEAHLPAFEAVFGPMPADPPATLALVGKALEAFERTLSPGASRFDRYVAEIQATGTSGLFTDAESRGLRAFLDHGCVNCHNGPLLTDHSFHNLGVQQVTNGGFDVGRSVGAVKLSRDPYNCLGAYSDAPSLPDGPRDCPELRYLDVTFVDWLQAFKTPTLRNVALTAPYMHDGSLPTLESVLDFYSELPGKPIVGHRELTLEPLDLSEGERADLVAFLGTLNSER